MQTNPETVLRKAERLNPARAQKLNKLIVEDHFGKLKAILTKHDLLNFPERIFNMDENGCRLQLHKDPRALAQKGAKRVTVMACGNAVGSTIPSNAYSKECKKIQPGKKSVCRVSIVRMTQKGSMTTETFVELIRHFVRFKPNGTCLLIFDGAKTHLDYNICKVAEKNEVIL
ncbi:hypothetical protein ILUMI_15396 [Ignelater luminosus]|uniref:Uncharacterized protein n=1 Tax=Ignelater luminosus TaxID=2038154 RepID=A0A8K0CT08_IGNLU|nr:hypothetical protein ILUMI_15396 [Ignelater luminosus]